jgi:hypothetical protein
MTRFIAPFGIVLAAVGMLAACTVAAPTPWSAPVAADGSGSGGDSGAKAPRK